MMGDTRMAEQAQAVRDMRAHHIDDQQAAPSLGDEFGDTDARWTPVTIDPQWVTVWKLYLAEDGTEYGVPTPVTRDMWDRNGKNSLVYARRPDGGYVFSAIAPANQAPDPPYECIVNECNGANLGGRRKRLPNLTALIEHVEAFHPRDAKIYQKHLARLMDEVARSNPRLMALQTSTQTPAAFYCDAADCSRFFDSEAGLTMHGRKEHREESHG